MKMVQKKVDRKAEYPHYARSHTLMANRLNIRKNSATNQSKREDLRFLTRKTRTEGNGSHHTISITISADKRISTHSCLGNTYTKCHLKSWNFWNSLSSQNLRSTATWVAKTSKKARNASNKGVEDWVWNQTWIEWCECCVVRCGNEMWRAIRSGRNCASARRFLPVKKGRDWREVTWASEGRASEARHEGSNPAMTAQLSHFFPTRNTTNSRAMVDGS